MKFSQALLGANPLDWPRIAAAAEEAGFDSVAVSDHVVYPARLDSRYPYTPDGVPLFSPDEDWPDPWVAVGAMSAVTTRLRFLTNVYVLPLRNPFVVAKAVGTAAYLSRGRVGLGIGAGWMAEEFELMGQPFARRGKRMDEMVEVVRTLWRGGMVEHHGEFYDFDPVEMRPAPPAPVPIYVGGHSEIAMRRAATLGDGWLGMYYSVEKLEQHCRTLERAREDAGTADRPFEIIASPMVTPTAENCERLEAAGVTTILTSAWMAQGVLGPDSTEQAIELIATFGERFIA
ncbi:MAG TPA: LLM class F420-dependent oxidoreductase [Microthrixaceae bacterium]|nr:LLM class F420-dependent oxidoreductase [Microthrixaceae bacterium]MCB9376049.1 LLM class F420-dependent oxidoreductase [Microthrixaceae bacterium]MCB9402613.1 LLM class F420-dependent oxidoreductase [Microthrixaceae bacterium]MCO5305958.1 LLM class F420-dependent oxidoreductase [Microthrixaceae bacterium]HMU80645.1 LLM class F420-dependent oxidoreductase [Microthrixaceae bacterium]